MNPTRFSNFLLQELWSAYHAVRRGKTRDPAVHRFELNSIENLLCLRDEIISRQYFPSPGDAFIINHPVLREVIAPAFRDRIVHQFLCNLSEDWWDRHFIADSYACRKKRGPHYALTRLAKHVRQVSENYELPVFAMKLDLQNFFLSLPHRELYHRVLWGLDQQFCRESPRHFRLTSAEQTRNQLFCHPADLELLYQTAKFLWRTIISYRPHFEELRLLSPASAWRNLPPSKSLFRQPKTRGIAAGNSTSQLLANLYLDQLDRFITQNLGYAHYGRYVDDFYLLVPMSERQKLLHDQETIRDFLCDNLKLTLHPHKQYHQPLTNGLPFIGYVIYPKSIVPGRRIRSELSASAYSVMTRTDDQSLELFEHGLRTHAHFDYQNFYQKLFDHFGWDYEI